MRINSFFSFRYNFTGFTVVELLVTITIMGVLMIGVISIVDPVGGIQKSIDAKRKSELAQVQRILELYYHDNGQYPASLSFGSAWLPYSPKLPKDPNPAKSYAYKTISGQDYYLYASLDRGAYDPQACNAGSACVNSGGLSCGGVCNFGLTSSNVTP
jgi:Tfp pilus assembly protein PilE